MPWLTILVLWLVAVPCGVAVWVWWSDRRVRAMGVPVEAAPVPVVVSWPEDWPDWRWPRDPGPVLTVAGPDGEDVVFAPGVAVPYRPTSARGFETHVTRQGMEALARLAESKLGVPVRMDPRVPENVVVWEGRDGETVGRTLSRTDVITAGEEARLRASSPGPWGRIFPDGFDPPAGRGDEPRAVPREVADDLAAQEHAGHAGRWRVYRDGDEWKWWVMLPGHSASGAAETQKEARVMVVNAEARIRREGVSS